MPEAFRFQNYFDWKEFQNVEYGSARQDKMATARAKKQKSNRKDKAVEKRRTQNTKKTSQDILFLQDPMLPQQESHIDTEQPPCHNPVINPSLRGLQALSPVASATKEVPAYDITKDLSCFPHGASIDYKSLQVLLNNRFPINEKSINGPNDGLPRFWAPPE